MPRLSGFLILILPAVRVLAQTMSVSPSSAQRVRVSVLS